MALGPPTGTRSAIQAPFVTTAWLSEQTLPIMVVNGQLATTDFWTAIASKRGGLFRRLSLYLGSCRPKLSSAVEHGEGGMQGGLRG